MTHPMLALGCRQHHRTQAQSHGDCICGRRRPVAILNRNQPAFYCVPAKTFEALMDKLEDQELNTLLARNRQK